MAVEVLQDLTLGQS